MAFKMKGPSLYKNGASLKVQKDYSGQADGRATSSPFQQKKEEKPKKPEVNQWGETPEEYKQRVIDMGLAKPEKKEDKLPLKQRVTKGGEGQDENKIFDNKGNHIGDWKDGKKVMKNAGKEIAEEAGISLATSVPMSKAGTAFGKSGAKTIKRTLTSNLMNPPKKKE